MKRPAAATALLFGILVLAGCSKKEIVEQRCVDKDRQVVDDSFCDDRRGTHPVCVPCFYHWIYGGNLTGYVPPGTVILGGRTTPPDDAEFSRPTSAPAFGGKAPVVGTSDAASTSASRFAVSTSEGFTARGVFGSAGEAAGGHGGE